MFSIEFSLKYKTHKWNIKSLTMKHIYSDTDMLIRHELGHVDTANVKNM
jgi:hypothetical protein